MSEAGVVLVDAPVARLRQAAEDGTLLITVGADERAVRRAEPLLSRMGSDIVHAGGAGTGQVLKILNNMVLFINMNAIAEALAIGRAAGVDGADAVPTLEAGIGRQFRAAQDGDRDDDSRRVPDARVPDRYAIKDLALALRLAHDRGSRSLSAPPSTMDLLQRTHDAGFGDDVLPRDDQGDRGPWLSSTRLRPGMCGLVLGRAPTARRATTT